MPAGPACPTCHRKGTYSPKFGTCTACADEKALKARPAVTPPPARKPAAKKVTRQRKAKG